MVDTGRQVSVGGWRQALIDRIQDDSGEEFVLSCVLCNDFSKLCVPVNIFNYYTIFKHLVWDLGLGLGIEGNMFEVDASNYTCEEGQSFILYECMVYPLMGYQDYDCW